MLTFKAQNVQRLVHLNHDKLTASPVDSNTSKESLLLCARLLKVKWVRWIPDHKIWNSSNKGQSPQPTPPPPPRLPKRILSSLLACVYIWSTGEYKDGHTHTPPIKMYIRYTSDFRASFSTKLKILFFFIKVYTTDAVCCIGST